MNNFTVLKEMGKRRLDIQLAPLSNITDLKKVKAGTRITMGVAGDVVAAIALEEKYIGGLILANKKQFEEVKEDLKSEVRFRLIAEDYNGHSVSGQVCCCDRCVQLIKLLQEAAE